MLTPAFCRDCGAELPAERTRVQVLCRDCRTVQQKRRPSHYKEPPPPPPRPTLPIEKVDWDEVAL